MPNTEPDAVTCIKNLKLDNGHEFQAGETYDLFTIREHSGFNYRVGQNRVRLSLLTADQFNNHFEGPTPSQPEKQRLFD